MLSQRLVNVAFAAIATASLAVSPVLVQPVLAAGGTSGWTNCNWAWKENTATPNITFRQDGSFPGDVFKDGVIILVVLPAEYCLGIN